MIAGRLPAPSCSITSGGTSIPVVVLPVASSEVRNLACGLPWLGPERVQAGLSLMMSPPRQILCGVAQCGWCRPHSGRALGLLLVAAGCAPREHDGPLGVW